MVKDVISNIARDVINTVWTGIDDVFSSAAGALVAIVVAILLSIVPLWILVLVAGGLFVGIVYGQYKETLDKETEK